MSTTPLTRNIYSKISETAQEDNNNARNKFCDRQQARTFITWYKYMADHDRQNLGLYLSDDATLEWFGRTIKTRKKVSAFLKYDMECSRHDFTTVESIEKMQTRQETIKRKDDSVIVSPLVTELNPKNESSGRKRSFKASCSSPEWAEGCEPNNEITTYKRKRTKFLHIESMDVECGHDKINHDDLKKTFTNDFSLEISSKGDSSIEKQSKRKCVPVTPPFKERGQGDCLPSTSSDRSHDTLNAQLPKLAVECNGYIEFTRVRNNRAVDVMKWERKCKVQICYSEDPLNVGEYIIWALRYTDESKCRRNLLAAFEEVAKEDLAKPEDS